VLCVCKSLRQIQYQFTAKTLFPLYTPFHLSDCELLISNARFEILLHLRYCTPVHRGAVDFAGKISSTRYGVNLALSHITVLTALSTSYQPTFLHCTSTGDADNKACDM